MTLVCRRQWEASTVTDETLANIGPRTIALDTDRGRVDDRQNNGLVEPVESQQPDYADLKRRIVAEGLLDKQLGYYVFNTIVRLSLLAASIFILFTVDNLWLQLLNAALLGFVFTQIGFLGHDAGHRQIFNGAPRNDLYGLMPNFVLGLSRSWWIDTHNLHHTNPNDLDLDPHTALPVFAFSQEQAESKRGFLRTMIKHQRLYFYPVFLLEGIGVRTASLQYLMRPEARRRVTEASLMVVHFVVYFALVFSALSVGQAVLFIIVHQMVFGLYTGTVFAPNHKGMLILDKDSQLDFVRRQVLTSRNIKAHPLTDFWYGGLNYQIEHHLFPSMPRNRLRKAQVIVKAFCAERGISYHEGSVLQSNREILSYLHEVGAPLRAPNA